jgi:hypothetical protein
MNTPSVKDVTPEDMATYLLYEDFVKPWECKRCHNNWCILQKQIHKHCRLTWAEYVLASLNETYGMIIIIIIIIILSLLYNNNYY